MAAIEAPEKIGIRPFDEFSEIEGIWPRGDRLDAIREAAGRFRKRFATRENRIRAVKTVDLAAARVALYRAQGFKIEHIRRASRAGGEGTFQPF